MNDNDNPNTPEISEEANTTTASPVIHQASHFKKLPSLESFKRGEPERVVMTQKPKVAITWLHTNEFQGPTVAHELYGNYPEIAASVNYICGNPHTARHDPDKGFTHTDLNRSFSPEQLQNPRTYEEERAVEVTNFVKNAEYILDLHNTVCTNFGKAAIIDERLFDHPTTRKMLAASPLKRILLMPTSVARLCLNGDPTGRAITFEYENDMTESEAVPDMIQLIEALVTGEVSQQPFEREVFHVYKPIPKSEDPGLETKNFEPFIGADGKEHYAAFLGTGPRSYREDSTKDYCGFYATMERVIL